MCPTIFIAVIVIVKSRKVRSWKRGISVLSFTEKYKNKILGQEYTQINWILVEPKR
jgi:hypothetical protein